MTDLFGGAASYYAKTGRITGKRRSSTWPARSAPAAASWTWAVVR
ncbi:hypothetical protein ABT294_19385 [Nonomuraea sp. NPDC000554]